MIVNNKRKLDLRETIRMSLTDSDDCFASDSIVMNCDPCQFDGSTEEAIAFCNDCKEFLCQHCAQSHRWFRAFSLHSILRGDSMPRTKEETIPKLELKLCDDHPLNEMQFYCKNHQAVFCRLCKIAKHSSCECEYMQDVCKTVDERKLNESIQEIETIRKDLERLKLSDTLEIDSSSVNSKRSRFQLDFMRQEMNEYFEKFEENVTDEEKQVNEMVARLRENVRLYSDAVNNISSLQEHIDQVSNSNDDVAIFAAKTKLKKVNAEYIILKNTIPLKPEKRTSKKANGHLTEVQRICDNIYKQVNPKTTEDSNIEKEDAIRSEASFEEEMSSKDQNVIENSNNKTNCCTSNEEFCDGEFYQREEPKEQTSQSESTSDPNEAEERGQKHKTLLTEMSFENLKPIERAFKSISTEQNDSTCDITGSLFLSDGSLVLCDHANSNVILLDKDLKLLHTLPVERRPWDVALVDTKEIVVSLTSHRSITYMKVVAGKLRENRCIYLKRVPWGIAVYKDYLITSFHNNPGQGAIEIRNKHDGKLLNSTSTEKGGEDLFAAPYYITVDQNNGNIYVTDSRKNGLTVLTIHGKPLHKIESDDFRWPRKVVLDIEGNCLLCASLANKLILINKQSESSHQSQKGRNGFTVWLKNSKRPQTVSVRWEDQTTVVGLSNRNEVLVLK